MNYTAPVGITEIPDYAYSTRGSKDDSGIESVDLGSEVEKVGEWAFAYNKSLKSVTIPANVKSVGQDAFGYTGLEKVEFENLEVDVGRYSFRSSPVKEMIFHAEGGFTDDDFKHIDRLLTSVDKEDLEKITLVSDNETVSVPYRYCAQRGGGIKRPYKLKLLAEAVKADIELNYESTKLLYREVHKYQQQDDETLGKVIKAFENYPKYGIFSLSKDFSDKLESISDEDFAEYRKTLKSAFVKKFRFYPRILDEITYSAILLGLKPETVIDTFHITKTKQFVDKHIPPAHGILGETFAGDVFDQIIEKPYFASLCLCMQEALSENDDKKKNLVDWVVAHKDTKNEFIYKVLSERDKLNIQPDDTVRGVEQAINNLGCLDEVLRIEKRYSNSGFKFADCVCKIPEVTTTTGKYRCEIMKADDMRAVMLGEYTDCCQHLDGAGESAMMLGLASPYAGFWILSNKDTGEILAQALVWEDADYPVLVFDNIEFKNDADISLYTRAIGEWCEKAPYDRILMGVGYNQLASLNGFEVESNSAVDGYAPLVDAQLLYILDNAGRGDIDEYEQIYDDWTPDEIYEEFYYSDAMSDVAVLKKDGKVAEVLLPNKQRDRGERD